MEVDQEKGVTNVQDPRYDVSLAPRGDVIISLRSPEVASGRVLHRVDKAILSCHSPVFAGLFSLPCDSTVNEMYDGVPVVRLEDDPKDMNHLLCYMYRPSSCLLSSPVNDFYVRAVGLLNVARKYEVDSIRDFVVNALQKDWPTTLADWIICRGKTEKLEELHDTSTVLVEDMWPDECSPEPGVAVRLAIDNCIPSILPGAMYCLSNIDIAHDWDRFHRFQWDFGGQALEVPNEDNPIYSLKRTARWSLLDKDTLYRVLLGKGELQKRQKRFHLYRSALCEVKAPGICVAEMIRLNEEFTSKLGGEKYPGFLEAVISMIGEVERSNLCLFACRGVVLQQIDDEARTIWEDLPRVFALDTIPGFEKHHWSPW